MADGSVKFVKESVSFDIYQALGVKTIDELKVAAETHRIRTLRGLSERTEQMILEGIAKLEARETLASPAAASLRVWYSDWRGE